MSKITKPGSSKPPRLPIAKQQLKSAKKAQPNQLRGLAPIQRSASQG